MFVVFADSIKIKNDKNKVKQVYYQEAIFEVIDINLKEKILVLLDDMKLVNKEEFYLNLIVYILKYHIHVKIIGNEGIYGYLENILTHQKLELIGLLQKNDYKNLNIDFLKQYISLFKENESFENIDFEFVNQNLPNDNFVKKKSKQRKQLIEGSKSNNYLEKNTFNELKKKRFDNDKISENVLLMFTSADEYFKIFNIDRLSGAKTNFTQLYPDTVIKFLHKNLYKKYILCISLDKSLNNRYEEVLNLLYYIKKRFENVELRIIIKEVFGVERLYLKKLFDIENLYVNKM